MSMISKARSGVFTCTAPRVWAPVAFYLAQNLIDAACPVPRDQGLGFSGIWRSTQHDYQLGRAAWLNCDNGLQRAAGVQSGAGAV